MNTYLILAAVAIGVFALIVLHQSGYLTTDCTPQECGVPTLTFAPNPATWGGQTTATLTGFPPNSTAVIMTGCDPCDIMVASGIAINSAGVGSAQFQVVSAGMMRASVGGVYADAVITVIQPPV